MPPKRARDHGTHPIPFIYRLVFNYIEPFLAIGGSIQIFFAPESYLATANPNTLPYHSSHLSPLYTSITSGWLLLAFQDLVTLRYFNRDVMVWRFVLTAHLLSDIAYTYALFQDLGSPRFWDVRVWDSNDWLTVGTTIPPLVLKVCYILGVGVDFNGATSSGKAVKAA